MPTVPILEHIKQILTIIYSKEETDVIFEELKNLMDAYANAQIINNKRKKYNNRVSLNERDAILITYPDTISKDGESPLCTLHNFLKKYVNDAVSAVHVLPFFPSSSDGGYAVRNYKEVDSRFGSWAHIQNMAHDYRLMVDLVMNHVSSKSEWFEGFLQGEKQYREYFIWTDKPIDMPKVFRPRETPLFTKFDTAIGEKYVWTTFSADQIDLNYKNPEVLLKIIDVLLFYLSQGIEIIRLDAIGYVWKEPHTSCVNLAKTHQIVKLLRRILEYAAPYAIILTEANFPYKENVSYFGEGHEANMVYNFSLPPLVVDAFARQDVSYIREETNRHRQDLLFFDILASHDGIGLSSAKVIFKQKDLENLLYITYAHGGLISYELKNDIKVPYELNISFFDAINNPHKVNDSFAVKRFIASQAIMLVLKGVPGVYIHSLLGSRNYYKGVEDSGIKRMINRESLSLELVESVLSDVHSLQYQVLIKFLRLLNARKQISSFHPYGTRKVLDFDKSLLVVMRQFEGEKVYAIINVSDITIKLSDYTGKTDLITHTSFDGNVAPYGVYFLN